MKRKIAASLAIVLGSTFGISAQRTRTQPKAAAEAPIVFAVLNDGTRLEPIVQLDKGRLVAPVEGGQESGLIATFNKQYYKLGRQYPVVLGGTSVGAATVRRSNEGAECAKNTANITSKVTGPALKGFVMALATSIPVANKINSRVKPTAEQKAEVEALVKSEYSKNKITGLMRFHNLTAIDVDKDGKAELVGSYWIANAKTQRAVLFFIAQKNAAGKYAFGFTDYRVIKESEVMSKEIAAVDRGIYHEMLLDVLDYDSDGGGEIFTHVSSFEGSGFMIYKRSGAKWTKVFEGSNYHCAY